MPKIIRDDEVNAYQEGEYVQEREQKEASNQKSEVRKPFVSRKKTWNGEWRSFKQNWSGATLTNWLTN